jgi:hypothetical protein
LANTALPREALARNTVSAEMLPGRESGLDHFLATRYGSYDGQEDRESHLPAGAAAAHQAQPGAPVRRPFVVRRVNVLKS